MQLAKARAALEERQAILDAAEAALAADGAEAAVRSSQVELLWSLEPSMPTKAEAAIMAALLKATHTQAEIAAFVAGAETADIRFEQMGAEFTAPAADWNSKGVVMQSLRRALAPVSFETIDACSDFVRRICRRVPPSQKAVREYMARRPPPSHTHRRERARRQRR